LSADIGVRCELLAMRYLLDNGYSVATPFGNHLPYDLIAEKDGVCWKVQVKGSSSLDERERTFRFYTRHKRYTRKEVDCFVVVHTELVGVWYCFPNPYMLSFRLPFKPKGSHKRYLYGLPHTCGQDELL